MFAVAERDRVRARLLGLAEADIDLAVAVRGPLDEALDRWTDWLYRDFGAVHHWDKLTESASVGHGASANPGAADAHYQS